MRNIQVVEEDGYYMAFASDDGKNAFIGEGRDREQAVKDAHELADLHLNHRNEWLANPVGKNPKSEG